MFLNWVTSSTLPCQERGIYDRFVSNGLVDPIVDLGGTRFALVRKTSKLRQAHASAINCFLNSAEYVNLILGMKNALVHH